MELAEIQKKRGFICDMDGVIYHGNRLLSGVPAFVDWLQRENKQFLFLTSMIIITILPGTSSIHPQ